MFRAPFNRILPFNSITAFALIAIFSVVRVKLVLDAQISGSYQYVSLIFIAMALFTLAILSREGRRKIGLVRPVSLQKMVQVLVWGILAALIMGLAANYNFDLTAENWFVYISNSYGDVPGPLSTSDRWVYFGIFALVGMTFSPIGEELFYRGLVHEMLVPQFGQKPATLIDSLAFSLVHLAHFGIYPTPEGWGFHPYAAFLWVGFLILTCIVFTVARQATGSIWGAVAAHAGYNLGMNAIIFFYILD